jgi:orotate phosphoribosyltransferase
MRSASEILSLSAADLRGISEWDYEGRKITPEEVDHLFRLCDALWLHNGDPLRPHVELTSGKHSNGFVNTSKVLVYTNLNRLLASALLNLYRQHCYAERGGQAWACDPDWVVGSDHAAATFSYEVAAACGARHDFTEKADEGTSKRQLWKRHVIPPGETVLQVEELVTTLATVRAVREGIRQGNSHPVTFAPAILTLVHRPSDSETEFEGSPILSLRRYDIQTWEAGECPLCLGGSEAIRPKQRWAELTAQ